MRPVPYPRQVETAVRQLPPGTMLDEKYRIERLLAEGGMGAVYEGTHVGIRKRVAIKLLNPQLSSPAMVERFHREAITASQIGHEGIAQTTDLGTSSQGEPFLVMELLEGESLAARLASSGPMPIDLACELGCAILSPLAAAHRAGVVHRDLKPDNVFLVRQSRGEMVKLLDFGISRAVGLEGEFRLTTTGLVLGTPFYMSPEQARGETSITPAADLYAVGVILYEMLAGVVPIHADNYNQLMYRVMAGDFVPLRQRRAEVPVELEQLVLRAMARDPSQRPGTAEELEHDLLAFCRPTYREHMIERISATGVPIRMTPRPTPRPVPTPAEAIAPTHAASASTPPSSDVHARRRHPSAALFVAGFVAVSAVTAIIAFAWLRERGDPSRSASPVAGTEPSPGVTDPPRSLPPTTETAAPALAAPTPVAPPPSTITLRFSVVPTHATVTVDGQRVTDGELVVTRDSDKHDVTIAAPGFVTRTEHIAFDETQRLSFQLARVDPPARKPPARRPPAVNKPDRIDTDSPYK